LRKISYPSGIHKEPKMIPLHLLVKRPPSGRRGAYATWIWLS